jgi:hypothetical protein
MSSKLLIVLSIFALISTLAIGQFYGPQMYGLYGPGSIYRHRFGMYGPLGNTYGGIGHFGGLHG